MGAGSVADLSMEDMIPADGGNKNIPLIFDIPPSARDLRLLVRGAGRRLAGRRRAGFSML